MNTTKKDEALKLALEALESLRGFHICSSISCDGVITAIREALMSVPDGAQSLCDEEQPAQGCEFCSHPLYAGTKCKNCGREQPAIKQDLTPEQPAQQEPTVEDNSQNWRGMDGTTAYWLIQRHADGWADIGKMMGEWLAANQAQPAQQQEPLKACVAGQCPCKSECDSAQHCLYTSPPASKPWVGLTDEDIRPLCSQSWVFDTVKQWTQIIEAKLREKNA